MNKNILNLIKIESENSVINNILKSINHEFYTNNTYLVIQIQHIPIFKHDAMFVNATNKNDAYLKYVFGNTINLYNLISILAGSSNAAFIYFNDFLLKFFNKKFNYEVDYDTFVEFKLKDPDNFVKLCDEIKIYIKSVDILCILQYRVSIVKVSDIGSIKDENEVLIKNDK